ncbi:RpnC/YadD family protein [Sphaerimonospora thailandensis]|uniref:Uncharacterized protein n=1 Tax=Sphaerimonospora thailandensis TaxID=795644 RepID=A0A8J3RAN9_9ACTN|nr:hypothetical protein [Sphaerimonospora thailandensis]GIH70422.1 hypothetical protein Mth01_26750 [Sphaerimonospora thailandensis]
MPSAVHDTLNLMFRNRPELAVEMLRDQLGVAMPGGLPVQLVGNELNDRPSKDLYPDTVITVGPRHHPVQAIIVEIQREEDEAKQAQLPRYAAALWLQLRCPVRVLVICPQAKVAAWAAKPIPTELPGYTLICHVIGPEQIPVVVDPGKAAAHPELAALSVMTHGDREEVLEAFVAALQHLPGEHAPQYYEYAFRLASEAARHLMEKLMESAVWPVYSPFAQKHYGKGLEAGRAAGLEAGRAAGLQEGRAEGEARAVLAVLQVRGIPFSDADHARITTCTDLDRLDAWARRAVTATSTADLFTDDPERSAG